MKYEVNFSGGFYLTADEDKIEEDFETVKKRDRDCIAKSWIFDILSYIHANH